MTCFIQLDPECSIAFYNRGVCYQHLGTMNKALKDYSVVLMLEKEHTLRVSCASVQGIPRSFISTLARFQRSNLCEVLRVYGQFGVCNITW